MRTKIVIFLKMAADYSAVSLLTNDNLKKNCRFLIYKSKTKCDRINMQTKKLFFSKKQFCLLFNLHEK